MNRFTAIILMLCLSCQLVMKLSIYAWFKINQDYIAATFCENKSKPELVCCGKCVLTKVYQKVDESQNKNHKNTQEKSEQNSSILFILPNENAPIQYSELTVFVKNPTYSNHHHFAYAQSVFHPPTV